MSVEETKEYKLSDFVVQEKIFPLMVNSKWKPPPIFDFDVFYSGHILNVLTTFFPWYRIKPNEKGKKSLLPHRPFFTFRPFIGEAMVHPQTRTLEDAMHPQTRTLEDALKSDPDFLSYLHKMQRKYHLFFDFSCEFSSPYAFSLLNNLNPSRTVLFTAQNLNKNNYNFKILHYNHMATSLIVLTYTLDYYNYFAEKLSRLRNTESSSRLAICHNGHLKRHKIAIVNHIFHNNNQDKVWCSLVGAWGRGTEWMDTCTDRNYVQWIYDWIVDDLKINFPELDYDYNKVKDLLPLITGDEDIYNDNCFSLCYKKGLDSYFNIVTETWIDNATSAIPVSEKSYKPIAYLQPFVIYSDSGHGYIDYLKQQGFDVFDDFINHDYDLKESRNERISLFLKEVDRLLAIPDNDWRMYCKEIIPRLLYNLNILQTLSNSAELNSFINNFFAEPTRNRKK